MTEVNTTVTPVEMATLRLLQDAPEGLYCSAVGYALREHGVVVAKHGQRWKAQAAARVASGILSRLEKRGLVRWYMRGLQVHYLITTSGKDAILSVEPIARNPANE